MQFLALGLLNIAAVGIALRVMRLLKVESPRDFSRWIWFLGIGLGFLSLFVFLLGIFGLLYPWIAWLSCLAFVGIALPEILKEVKTVRARWFSAWKELDIPTKLLICLLVVQVAINFVAVLAPPTEGDSLGKHILLPRQFIVARRVYFVGDNVHIALANLVHMLYTYGMLLSSDAFPGLLEFEIGLLTAALIYFIGKQNFGPKVGWLACAMFYAMPIVTRLSTGAQVDVAVTFFTLVAVHQALFLADGDRLGSFVFVGMSAGFAAGVKFVGLFTPAALFVLMVLYQLRKCGIRTVVYRTAIFLVTAAIVCLPWYLKNVVWTGDPFFPFMYTFLGRGGGWNKYSAMVAKEFFAGLAGPYVEKGLIGLITGPWHVSVGMGIVDVVRLYAGMLHGSVTQTAPGVVGRLGVSATISPVFLVFLPLVLFVRRNAKALWFLGGSSLVIYIQWYITTPSFAPRHLLLALPPLAVVLAAGLYNSSLMVGRVKLLPLAIIFSTCLSSIAITGMFAAQFVPYVIGTESRDSLLERTTWCYRDMLWMNSHLRQGDKVATTTAIIYYLQHPHLFLDPCLQGIIDFSELKDTEEFASALRGMGVTHVYVNLDWLPSENTKIPHTVYRDMIADLIRSDYVELVYSNDRCRFATREPFSRKLVYRTALYRLKAVPPGET